MKIKYAYSYLAILLAATTILAASNQDTAYGNIYEARPLQPFFDVYSLPKNALSRPYAQGFTCPSPPAPVRDLYFESVYSSEKGNSSVIDPKAYHTYKSATKFINLYESGLASMSNHYLQSNPSQPAIARCVLDWLWIWAKSKALNGHANRTGEFVRKWVLASIASSWAQIKNEPTLDRRKKTTVEHWMRNVANTVRHDFSAHATRRSRMNNHLYWAAWGVMATGVALNQRDLYEWGLKRARYGIRSIQQDGTLPLEMARGRRALNYHSYAAIPLFLMAETAAHNGDDLYSENHFALFRLAQIILQNLKKPSYFEQKTGEKQDIGQTITSANLVWLEIYYKKSHNSLALKYLKKLRPMKLSRVGGNLTYLLTSSNK